MKSLVISPTGNKTLATQWVRGNPSFDVCFLTYQDVDKDILKLAKYHFDYRLEKWEMIHKLIIENLDIILQYDYFWFVDDDISTSCNDINNLFKIAVDYQLKLAQPSISGFRSFPQTKRVSGMFLRYTNFVEIMCPLMSKETLLKLFPTFIETKSGWGIDFIWKTMLNPHLGDLAIIDLINVRHVDKVKSKYGGRFKVKPQIELERVLYRLGDSYDSVKVIREIPYNESEHNKYIV